MLSPYTFFNCDDQALIYSNVVMHSNVKVYWFRLFILTVSNVPGEDHSKNTSDAHDRK